MPFCPICHYEYRQGFTRCTDCDVELVETLFTETGPEPEKAALELVELGSFPDPMIAEMIRYRLRNRALHATQIDGDCDTDTDPDILSSQMESSKQMS